MNVQTLVGSTRMAGPTEHGQHCGAPAVVAHTLNNGQTLTVCSEHAAMDDLTETQWNAQVVTT
jgi:hypothetical protein